MKGHTLNKISYQQREEDIGTIQQNEQSFAVAFAVVKDSCDQFLRVIGSELRSFLVRKQSLIDRSHLKISQLDEISKQIYSKYRIFLIFDTKSQPGRVISFYSCFYPNVQFNLEKIRKKDGLIFRGNQVLNQLKRGQILNNYGFLTLDSKERLVIIKKDDPELRQDKIIGVWVVSSYQQNRTKKQFSKEDSIWIALLDFYTNPDIQEKLSIIVKQKGFLCYFGFKKQQNKLNTPQFYLFEPNCKFPPKYNFAIKNQLLSQTNKSCEVKIEFINSTIVEEREYSEFSDQTNPNNYQQLNKYINQNINRDNFSRETIKKQKSQVLQNNQSDFSGSSQGKPNTNIKQVPQPSTKDAVVNKKSTQEDDQKNKIIKELRAELQVYKQKCIQLQAMNKILVQEKLMNPLLYSAQYSYMNQMHSTYHQPNNFSYPFSYSQVSPQNAYQINSYQLSGINQQVRQNNFPNNGQLHTQGQTLLKTSQFNQQISVKQKSNINQTNEENMGKREDQIISQKRTAAIYSFPEQNQQQFTLGSEKLKVGQASPKHKAFTKKIQSFGEEKSVQEFGTEEIKFEKVRERQIAKKDVRNISFQDSFAEYHSEQEDAPNFKVGGKLLNRQKDKKSSQQSDVYSSRSNRDNESIQVDKSPEFKKVLSLQSQYQKFEQYGLKQDSNNEKRTDNRQPQLQKQKSEGKNQNQLVKKQAKVNHPNSYMDILRKQSQQNQKSMPKKMVQLIKNDKSPNNKYNLIESSQEEEIKSQALSKHIQSPKNKQVTTKVETKIESRKKMPSQSDDSDDDIDMKKIREIYLKR